MNKTLSKTSLREATTTAYFSGVYLFYMDADLQGCLNQLDRSWKAFEHNGQPMYKHQVEAILKYGLAKGYKSLSQISDEETEKILSMKENQTFEDIVIIKNQLPLF